MICFCWKRIWIISWRNRVLYRSIILQYQTTCYVVIEVKITKFNPGDLGQLSTYVSSVNHLLKGKNDNPTIGILICKDKDKIVAEYSLENYNIPLGISSYELNKLLPKELKDSLTSIEELERKLGE